ncbi:hypothetical protein ACP70R_005786 [Stipagrostis hirtigluma subsp. patula]
MLMEIVTAFGPLGYKDHSITSKACAGLNGMKLGGCMLTAIHVYPNPPAEVQPYPPIHLPSSINFDQGADDVSEDPKEKVPTVATRNIAFVFEPGSVLVEFIRKEAACMAAHALHGRRFGNRTVPAGYASQ